MKKIVVLALALIGMVMPVSAQQKRSFTLEDVMPGGKQTASLQVENMNLAWWGDKLVKLGSGAMSTVDLKNGSDTPFLQLDEVKSLLKQQGLGNMGSFSSTRFIAGANKALFRTSTHMVAYNLDTHAVEAAVPVQGTQNVDVAEQTMKAAYTRENNLFVFSGNREIQVTNEPKGILCGQSVHRDEFGIRKGTFWSPKGNLLAFYWMDERMVADYPQVDISTRIATLVPDKYPMAGCTSHVVKVGVFNPETQQTVYLKTTDPVDRYFTNISWSPDEKSVFVIEVNRDQNHAELIQYDAQTGDKVALLYEETHPKYVEPEHPLTFLPWDSNKFIYQTERDGYNHLYLFDLAQKQEGHWQDCAAGGKCIEHVKVTPITTGDWMVKSIVGFSSTTKEIVLQTTAVTPIDFTLMAVNVMTGKQRSLGTQEGSHRASLSESGKWLLDNYTSAKIARNIDVLPLTGKAKTLNLLTASNPMDALNLPEVTVGTIKAADGQTDLYYRLIKPLNYDPNKKYPAIIYVYGGPHAQMITNTRNYAAGGWDMYMAQKGYVMLTVDGRGSDSRGLNFENATFRKLGTEEMKDQMKGVELLKSLGYVDENKIGVHGWSFGGFMTTDLMLTYNDTFKVGVAGGPVINWAYYEVMYGERYMDTPQSNPEGYDGNNLTLRAKDLKGKLQLIIGGNDPTCVPQHTLSFIRASINAETQPDLFIYPGDGHNMGGRDRVHLYTRITQYFDDHLK